MSDGRGARGHEARKARSGARFRRLIAVFATRLMLLLCDTTASNTCSPGDPFLMCEQARTIAKPRHLARWLCPLLSLRLHVARASRHRLRYTRPPYTTSLPWPCPTSGCARSTTSGLRPKMRSLRSLPASVLPRRTSRSTDAPVSDCARRLCPGVALYAHGLHVYAWCTCS